MDEGIRIALKKMKELKIEYEKLDRFVALHEELTGNKIPRDELLAGVDKLSESKATPVENEPKRRNNVKKLLDVAARVIREAGRPMTRSEISAGIERLKVEIHAKDKAKYIGTLLWRNSERFVSFDDGYVTSEMADHIESQNEHDPVEAAFAKMRVDEEESPVSTNQNNGFTSLFSKPS